MKPHVSPRQRDRDMAKPGWGLGEERPGRALLWALGSGIQKGWVVCLCTRECEGKAECVCVCTMLGQGLSAGHWKLLSPMALSWQLEAQELVDCTPYIPRGPLQEAPSAELVRADPSVGIPFLQSQPGSQLHSL